IVFYAVPVVSQTLVILLAFTAYTGLGNFAVFFQIACAGYLDSSRKRVVLLPFGLLSFVVNLVSISIATMQQIMSPIFRSEFVWRNDKQRGSGFYTVRKEAASGKEAIADLLSDRPAPRYHIRS